MLRESEGLERGLGGGDEDEGEDDDEGEDAGEGSSSQDIVQEEGESQEDALRKGLGNLGIEADKKAL